MQVQTVTSLPMMSKQRRWVHRMAGFQIFTTSLELEVKLQFQDAFGLSMSMSMQVSHLPKIMVLSPSFSTNNNAFFY